MCYTYPTIPTQYMPDAKNLRALCDLIEDGKIFPNIEKIYPSPRRR